MGENVGSQWLTEMEHYPVLDKNIAEIHRSYFMAVV